MKYRRRENTIEGQRERRRRGREKQRQIFQIPAWSTRKDPAILFREASSRKVGCIKRSLVYFSLTLRVRYGHDASPRQMQKKKKGGFGQKTISPSSRRSPQTITSAV